MARNAKWVPPGMGPQALAQTSAGTFRIYHRPKGIRSASEGTIHSALHFTGEGTPDYGSDREW